MMLFRTVAFLLTALFAPISASSEEINISNVLDATIIISHEPIGPKLKEIYINGFDNASNRTEFFLGILERLDVTAQRSNIPKGPQLEKSLRKPGTAIIITGEALKSHLDSKTDYNFMFNSESAPDFYIIDKKSYSIDPLTISSNSIKLAKDGSDVFADLNAGYFIFMSNLEQKEIDFLHCNTNNPVPFQNLLAPIIIELGIELNTNCTTLSSNEAISSQNSAFVFGLTPANRSNKRFLEAGVRSFSLRFPEKNLFAIREYVSLKKINIVTNVITDISFLDQPSSEDIVTACLDINFNNVDQVYNCIALTPRYLGSDPISSPQHGCFFTDRVFLSLTEKAYEVKGIEIEDVNEFENMNRPSCKIYADVITEIQGTEPHWTACLGYDPSTKVENFGRCLKSYYKVYKKMPEEQFLKKWADSGCDSLKKTYYEIAMPQAYVEHNFQNKRRRLPSNIENIKCSDIDTIKF